MPVDTVWRVGVDLQSRLGTGPNSEIVYDWALVWYWQTTSAFGTIDEEAAAAGAFTKAKIIASSDAFLFGQGITMTGYLSVEVGGTTFKLDETFVDLGSGILVPLPPQVSVACVGRAVQMGHRAYKYVAGIATSALTTFGQLKDIAAVQTVGEYLDAGAQGMFEFRAVTVDETPGDIKIFPVKEARLVPGWRSQRHRSLRAIDSFASLWHDVE